MDFILKGFDINSDNSDSNSSDSEESTETVLQSTTGITDFRIDTDSLSSIWGNNTSNTETSINNTEQMTDTERNTNTNNCIMPIEKYDGKPEDLSDWLSAYHMNAHALEWTEAQMAKRFPLHIKGFAIKAYAQLADGEKDTWEHLVRSFRNKLSLKDAVQTNTNDFFNRVQKPEERVVEYAISLKTMVERAFPTGTTTTEPQLAITRNQLLFNRFITGLRLDIRNHALFLEVQNFDEALRKARVIEENIGAIKTIRAITKYDLEDQDNTRKFSFEEVKGILQSTSPSGRYVREPSPGRYQGDENLTKYKIDKYDTYESRNQNNKQQKNINERFDSIRNREYSPARGYYVNKNENQDGERGRNQFRNNVNSINESPFRNNGNNRDQSPFRNNRNYQEQSPFRNNGSYREQSPFRNNSNSPFRNNNNSIGRSSFRNNDTYQGNNDWRNKINFNDVRSRVNEIPNYRNRSQSPQDRGNGRSVICFYCGVKGHVSTECQKRLRDEGNRQRDRVDTNGNMKCYQCNEFGHMARSCPKLQKSTFAYQNNRTTGSKQVSFNKAVNAVELQENENIRRVQDLENKYAIKLRENEELMKKLKEIEDEKKFQATKEDMRTRFMTQDVKEIKTQNDRVCNMFYDLAKRVGDKEIISNFAILTKEGDSNERRLTSKGGKEVTPQEMAMSRKMK